MATRYIVKLSGGNRAEHSVNVDGEYSGGTLQAARAEASWFDNHTVGGSIRIVRPIRDGNAVETVEVVR